MNDRELHPTLALPVHPTTVTVQSSRASTAVRCLNAPNITDNAGLRHRQIRLHLSPFFCYPFFFFALTQ